jgi:hypothetical protein
MVVEQALGDLDCQARLGEGRLSDCLILFGGCDRLPALDQAAELSEVVLIEKSVDLLGREVSTDEIRQRFVVALRGFNHVVEEGHDDEDRQKG